MNNQSLQDQLLKAGLVSDNKAKQVRSEKRKQKRQPAKNKTSEFDAKLSAQQQKTLRTEHDRLLNAQRKQQSKKTETEHQIKQLVDHNRLALPTNEDAVPYHFEHLGKVKTLYVDDTQRQQITSGRLAIVHLNDEYHLVNLETANKIAAKEAQAVVVRFDPSQRVAENNDYPGYEIPDDLIW